MRETIYGRNSPTRQWCDGQLHRPSNYQKIRDPNESPRKSNTTYQRRRDNQPGGTNRKILRNDHPKRTPKKHHTLLRDKPRRRSHNIRIPLAEDLQPPDRLGKRKSQYALAQGVGKKGNLHRPHRTNPGRIPATLKGIRQERSRKISPKARRRP